MAAQSTHREESWSRISNFSTVLKVAELMCVDYIVVPVSILCINGS